MIVKQSDRVVMPEGRDARHSVPRAFTPIDLGEGPRPIPEWARDADIRWRWAFDNRPDYALRCRADPLAFTRDGSPVWRPLIIETKTGSKTRPDQAWIAERDGVAEVHYHDGPISMVEFEENVTVDGKVLWEEAPDWRNGKPGKAVTRKYEMLATTKQEGYGGRHFDITLAACEIRIGGKLTAVPDGTRLRLRGPWHSSPPRGYREVSYLIDDQQSYHRAGTHWTRRTLYFGLCLRTEVLLDIMATHLPHIEWAMTEHERGIGLEPLVPQTGLPKNWWVEPEACPGHDYTLSPYDRPKPRPNDRCKLCGQMRDPSWVYVSDYQRQQNEKRRAAAIRGMAPSSVWPADVLVPPAPMRGRLRAAP